MIRPQSPVKNAGFSTKGTLFHPHTPIHPIHEAIRKLTSPTRKKSPGSKIFKKERKKEKGKNRNKKNKKGKKATPSISYA